MKVILRKEVEKLGEEGSVVNVSDGYARNYLFPKKLAVPATKKEIAAVEKRQALREKELNEKKAEFEELAKKLSALEVSIPADAGEGGKLFGAITSQDIALAVSAAAGIELDKKKIDLSEPIKALGEHKVLVKLFHDISTEIKIQVISK